MQKIKKFFNETLKKFTKRLADDSINVYAAQASFYIITAFIPFLALIITMIKFFIGMSQAELTAAAVSFFPETLYNFISDIIRDLYDVAPASVISVSAVIALWSSSKGMLAVRVGLNRVYHIDHELNFVKKRGTSLLYTLVFMLIIIFTLAVLVFGNSIMSLLKGTVPGIVHIISLLLCFKSVAAVIIFTVMFMFMYKYLPYQSSQRTLRGSLPGALVASLSWIVFSYFYGMYIDNYSKYSYIYGSIGALVLMLLWIYFCLEMVLFGAEVNEYFKDVFKPRKPKKKAVKNDGK